MITSIMYCACVSWLLFVFQLHCSQIASSLALLPCLCLEDFCVLSFSLGLSAPTLRRFCRLGSTIWYDMMLWYDFPAALPMPWPRACCLILKETASCTPLVILCCADGCLRACGKCGRSDFDESYLTAKTSVSAHSTDVLRRAKQLKSDGGWLICCRN